MKKLGLIVPALALAACSGAEETNGAFAAAAAAAAGGPGPVATYTEGCANNAREQQFDRLADVFIKTQRNASGLSVRVVGPGRPNEEPFVLGTAFSSWDGACGSLAALIPDLETTNNPGGTYKVWVCETPDFEANSTCNFHNFKLGTVVDEAAVELVKFYDADGNGVNDDAHPFDDAATMPIAGWKVLVQGPGVDQVFETPASLLLAPGLYTFTELFPAGDGVTWYASTEISQTLELAAGDDETVAFGNFCDRIPGGKTRGFWQGPNGRRLIDADALEELNGLNLYQAPVFGSAVAFADWIRNQNGSDMRGQLSAQLAATTLSVRFGFTAAEVIVGQNDQGAWLDVTGLMAWANELLAGTDRALQTVAKDLLDEVNNAEVAWVQPAPETCPMAWDAE